MFGEDVVIVVLQSVGVWSDHFVLQSSGSLSAAPPSSVAASSPFSWPARLPQQALEEQAVLVEVVHGVVVVGAWTLHELMEVAGGALLGRRARMISRGDQCGVGQ